MAEATKVDRREAEMVLRPGMTEAEIDAVLERGRELKRAIVWGKKRLDPLREHAKALTEELKMTRAAINDLEEGRIPKELPKLRRAVSAEASEAAKKRWTPEKRAEAAKRMKAMQRSGKI